MFDVPRRMKVASTNFVTAKTVKNPAKDLRFRYNWSKRDLWHAGTAFNLSTYQDTVTGQRVTTLKMRFQYKDKYTVEVTESDPAFVALIHNLTPTRKQPKL